MSAKKTVETLVNGGQATAGPPLGPALGPLGLNVLAVVKKINELTGPYAGMKVPVTVRVDTETKEFEVSVGTPTVSALIVKEQLVRVTKLKQSELLSKTFKGAVKEVAGTCVSMGITIDEKEPVDVQRAIDEGVYDKFLNA
jgi:large subunit ribosomal protein L11